MASKKVKAVLSPALSSQYNPRYVIIDTETGEILDDAQGYGYTSAQKAHIGYSYKTRDQTKDKEKAEQKLAVHLWIRNHRKFMEALLEAEIGFWKREGENLTAVDIKAMLEHYDDCPFTPIQILRGWKRFDSDEKRFRAEIEQEKRQEKHRKQEEKTKKDALAKEWLAEHKDFCKAIAEKEMENLDRNLYPYSPLPNEEYEKQFAQMGYDLNAAPFTSSSLRRMHISYFEPVEVSERKEQVLATEHRISQMRKTPHNYYIFINDRNGEEPDRYAVVYRVKGNEKLV